MKKYKCFDCDQEKVKARFHEGVLDDDPVMWSCKKCVNEAERYVNSPEVQAEIARQAENDD